MMGAYRVRSATSHVIQARHWSPYSHLSWIKADCGAIESWKGDGVVETDSYHEGHKPGTRIDLFDITLTPNELLLLEGFFRDQVGKKYDTRGVMHFVTKRPERIEDQDRWFCSELLAAGFIHINRPLLLRIPAWKTYPGLLTYSPLLHYKGYVIVNGAGTLTDPCVDVTIGRATSHFPIISSATSATSALKKLSLSSPRAPESPLTPSGGISAPDSPSGNLADHSRGIAEHIQEPCNPRKTPFPRPHPINQEFAHA